MSEERWNKKKYFAQKFTAKIKIFFALEIIYNYLFAFYHRGQQNTFLVL